jgi:hypothetical protein
MNLSLIGILLKLLNGVSTNLTKVVNVQKTSKKLKVTNIETNKVII